MKATGITRPVDDLGRVVIPKELRRNLDIKERDVVEIFVEGENIILRKYNPGCSCCNNRKDLVNVCGLNLCPSCMAEFKKAISIVDKVR